MVEELLLAVAVGCDRVCSSLEGSLAFAGTGLMAAVAVSAALAVSAVKHRGGLPSTAHGSPLRSAARLGTGAARAGTGPGGAGLAGAHHCSSGRCNLARTPLLLWLLTEAAWRLFSTSRLAAVAAASSAAAMAAAVAACSATSRSCRRLISSSGPVMAVASSAAMSVTVCLSSHPLCVAMAAAFSSAAMATGRQPFQARRWLRPFQRWHPPRRGSSIFLSGVH